MEAVRDVGVDRTVSPKTRSGTCTARPASAPADSRREPGGEGGAGTEPRCDEWELWPKVGELEAPPAEGGQSGLCALSKLQAPGDTGRGGAASGKTLGLRAPRLLAGESAAGLRMPLMWERLRGTSVVSGDSGRRCSGFGVGGMTSSSSGVAEREEAVSKGRGGGRGGDASGDCEKCDAKKCE